MMPDGVLDIGPGEEDRLFLQCYSSQGDMHMRVFGVVVRGRNPLETRIEVLFHYGHEVSRQFFQIRTLAKLRRNDELKQSGIARLLPRTQGAVNVGYRSSRTEGTDGTGIAMDGTLSCAVTAMGRPLSSCPVWVVCNSNRTSLHRRSRRSLGNSR